MIKWIIITGGEFSSSVFCKTALKNNLKNF
jgi:hypothetical protein